MIGIVRAATPADRSRVADFVVRTWGASRVAAHGEVFEIPELEGFVAEISGEIAGHAAYVIDGPSLEILSIATARGQQGAGSALLAACARVARERNLTRVWLITTNDNLDALRFYQRRGFRLLAVHPGAADAARRDLKPEIPEAGSFGIPIRDELQLELPRGEWDDLIARYSWPNG